MNMITKKEIILHQHKVKTIKIYKQYINYKTKFIIKTMEHKIQLEAMIKKLTIDYKGLYQQPPNNQITLEMLKDVDIFLQKVDEYTITFNKKI